MKKIHQQYSINVLGLDEKSHEFEFEGKDDFFESFDQDIIESGEFKLALVLDKSSSMMRLDYHITGTLKLICDRSLEVFEEPLNISEQYVYKFGDRNEVVSEDVEIIPFGTAEINIARDIFDYIGLSVPMKKLHPKFRDESEEASGLVFSSENPDVSQKEEERKEESNPMWDALKDFKKKL
ncbi:MAG: DUF177 domain-containing protein [Cytophagales bacterium]|nr:DUF177 domain-containing protein [Cytophagales bacterium]